MYLANREELEARCVSAFFNDHRGWLLNVFSDKRNQWVRELRNQIGILLEVGPVTKGEGVTGVKAWRAACAVKWDLFKESKPEGYLYGDH